MKSDRNLCFKAHRDYLHSTTVFDDILSFGRHIEDGVDFVFNMKTDRQVTFQDEAPEDSRQIVGRWTDADGTIYIVSRNESIVDRHDYDEDGVASRFEYAESSVRIDDPGESASLIEAMVAGYKALLLKTVAGADAKLAFVRLRLQSAPQYPVRIVFRRRIGEFFQADIESNGDKVGQIFFGEWK